MKKEQEKKIIKINILNKLLKECGTQTEVAKRLGVSQAFISKLLHNNNVEISFKLAKKICKSFDVSLSHIYPDFK